MKRHSLKDGKFMRMTVEKYASSSRVMFVVVLSLCMGLFPSQLRAGRGDKVGTASGYQLLIPIGARAVGLGGSDLSTVSGIEAMYWNPAGLARAATATSMMLSHMTYLADVDVQYLGLSTAAGAGYLGISVKSLSLGDIPITTEDQPDGTGETTSPRFMVFGGTFARQMSDQIYIGITANLLYEKMAEVSATNFALSAGVQYLGLGGIPELSVGVALKNIGPKMKYDGDGLIRTGQLGDVLRPESKYKIEAASADLPSTIEIGLGYSMRFSEADRLNLSSTFENNNFSDDEYKLGLEYGFRDFLSFRTGFSFSSESEGQEYIFGTALGAGVKTLVAGMRISVDYGYRSALYFGGNHVITLSLGF